MVITSEAGVSGYPDMNRRMGENVTTLLFRLGWKQKDLAAASGITISTLSRKLQGAGDWTLVEVGRVAHATNVEPHELVGTLPDFDEWEERRLRARRDSNPQPSDPVFPPLRLVKGGLTADRPADRVRIRHLKAVS